MKKKIEVLMCGDCPYCGWQDMRFVCEKAGKVIADFTHELLVLEGPPPWCPLEDDDGGEEPPEKSAPTHGERFICRVREIIQASLNHHWPVTTAIRNLLMILSTRENACPERYHVFVEIPEGLQEVIFHDELD